MMKIFNINYNNRLYITHIVDDRGLYKVGRWISGRVFGKYINIYIPRLRKKKI